MSAADFFEVADDAREVVDAPVDVTDVLSAQAEATVEAAEEMAVAASLDEVDDSTQDEHPRQTVAEVAASEGSAGIDLDVLAVADDRKLAVLVADILEQAVARGANRIHLFPYKNDFFLVFRIGGRLEKIASAPLSMQSALIDGFKSYAKLGNVPSDAAGARSPSRRDRRQAARADRLLGSDRRRPATRRLARTGTPGAARLPRARHERGRVARTAGDGRARSRASCWSPPPSRVAGRAPTTRCCHHAAAAGKTVYSVERSIEYEIPAVAQVLVNPGSPVGAASYFAAGIRQDTDVLAIDSMQSVEDVHLAIEAAGLGKLVIATFAGADIVAAVRRMLDLGAEPVSLASALTLGVGQRVVRTNCPNCAPDEKNPLADTIPGAEKGMSTRRGAGCPNCGKSGFAGATGIFEVLPFTEPVRAQIARDAFARRAGGRGTGCRDAPDDRLRPGEGARWRRERRRTRPRPAVPGVRPSQHEVGSGVADSTERRQDANRDSGRVRLGRTGRRRSSSADQRYALPIERVKRDPADRRVLRRAGRWPWSRRYGQPARERSSPRSTCGGSSVWTTSQYTLETPMIITDAPARTWWRSSSTRSKTSFELPDGCLQDGIAAARALERR